MVKCERNWNPLLVESQLDPYSNTWKERYSMPGTQEKIFRFVAQELIEMQIEDRKLNPEALAEEEGEVQDSFLSCNKVSVETMPSEFSSSCSNECL
jgi:hypothetical protein